MKTASSQQLKILFLAAILLPGLVLAWFALRTWREDRVLQVARVQNRMQQTASLILHNADDALAKFVETLNSNLPRDGALRQRAQDLVARVPPVGFSGERWPSRSAATDLTNDWLLIAFDATGAVCFPGVLLDTVSDPATISPSLQDALFRGRQAELAARRTVEALAIYEKALGLASNTTDRLLFSLHAGRAAARIGLRDDAVRHYETALRQSGGGAASTGVDATSSSRAPAERSIVQLVLGKIYLDRDPARGATFLVQLLDESFARGLTTPEDEFFRREALALLENHKPPAGALPDLPRLQTLNQALDRKRDLTRQLLQRISPAPFAHGETARMVQLDGLPYIVIRRTAREDAPPPTSTQSPVIEREGERPREPYVVVAAPWSQATNLMTSILAPYARDQELAFSLEFAAAVTNMPRNALQVQLMSTIVSGLQLRVWETETAQKARGGGARMAVLLGIIGLALTGMMAGAFLTFRGLDRQLELARLRSDFVSTVSHELRTPVTSIRLMSETLKAGRMPDPQAREEYHGIIAREAERLSRLVNNVLDFGRMEAGRKRFEFETVDLAELAVSVVQAFRDYHGQAGFQFVLNRPETPVPILADREAMEQVIFNLLDNAVKYTGSGRKEITVTIRADHARTVLEVKDCGVGIPAGELDRIFEKFYRIGDPLTRKSSGSGLGLALVKQWLDAHHAKVEVESKVGSGSLFRVVFVS